MTTHWTPARLGDLTGKRIIVTGATNGVGLGTARALTRAGAHVIMAVRNTELGAQRAKEIGGSTSIAKIDLADLSSVRAFADALDEDVDILINNAGGLTQEREETVDGFEKQIGQNMLGPFALTNLVFGRVRSQIINVGSDAHRSAKLRLDDMHLAPASGLGLARLRTLEARRDVVGAGTGSPTAGREFACGQLNSPIRGGSSSNLSHVSDRPIMAGLDRAGAGASPTCSATTSMPAPRRRSTASASRYHPAVTSATTAVRSSGRSCCQAAPLGGDYDVAAKVFEFAEKETGTALPV